MVECAYNRGETDPDFLRFCVWNAGNAVHETPVNLCIKRR